MDGIGPDPESTPPELGAYTADFLRGRPAMLEALWILLQWVFVSSPLPGSFHRRVLLRAFGAKIGMGVVIKPGVKVKFPWRLQVGANAWLGENAWIDNLAQVNIEANAVLSQDVYLCTGSHDWTSPGFNLIVKPILIKQGAWVAARSTIGPGVTLGDGAVLGLGSTTSKDLEPWTVYSGVPATPLKKRVIRSLDAPPGGSDSD